MFHSMYITPSLRVDGIHQVIIYTDKQEVLLMILGLGSTFLALNLRCPSISIQAEEEVVHMFRLMMLRRVIPGPCQLIAL